MFYRSDAEVPPCTEASKQAIRSQLERTLSAISGWEILMSAQHPGYRAFEGIDKRIQNLKMEMLDAGIAPLENIDSMAGIEEYPRTCFEMHVLLEEVIWKLHGILDEIRRRWADLGDEGPAGTQVLNWVIETENSIRPGKTGNAPHP